MLSIKENWVFPHPGGPAIWKGVWASNSTAQLLQSSIVAQTGTPIHNLVSQSQTHFLCESLVLQDYSKRTINHAPYYLSYSGRGQSTMQCTVQLVKRCSQETWPLLPPISVHGQHLGGKKMPRSLLIFTIGPWNFIIPFLVLVRLPCRLQPWETAVGGNWSSASSWAPDSSALGSPAAAKTRRVSTSPHHTHRTGYQKTGWWRSLAARQSCALVDLCYKVPCRWVCRVASAWWWPLLGRREPERASLRTWFNTSLEVLIRVLIFGSNVFSIGYTNTSWYHLLCQVFVVSELAQKACWLHSRTCTRKRRWCKVHCWTGGQNNKTFSKLFKRGHSTVCSCLWHLLSTEWKHLLLGLLPVNGLRRNIRKRKTKIKCHMKA